MNNSGISEETVIRQLHLFEKGIPYVQLDQACSIGNGITHIAESEFDELMALHAAASAEGRLTKFVPASGAASRMFDVPMTLYHRHQSIHRRDIEALASDSMYRDLLHIIDHLKHFAFFEDFEKKLTEHGYSSAKLLESGDYQILLKHLLYEPGLNYAYSPKALLPFHRYDDHTRTALEEHLVEAVKYVQDRENVASIHFTISPNHEEAINLLLSRVLRRYEKENVLFDISFSFQKPSTDTIAVDQNNRPLRDKEGKLIFRPSGHGALLQNLEELDGDIVFIKNIDNIVPDYLKETTIVYKKLLAGYLIKTQKRAFLYLTLLDSGIPSESAIREMIRFLQVELSVFIPPDFGQWSFDRKKNFIQTMLNRPLRVCGMVKNEGEPGGGPFRVKKTDGASSLQIVESTQVDMKISQQKTVFQSSKFFNPVDLVCGVRNYKGSLFPLQQFADPEAGLISIKSKDGMTLKALELPGLWNGGMAEWNTIFVEVPAITFNPVKTLLDLLRPEHQPQQETT
ncbi:DUF4301 family protein [bacterium]|nr:DUF4301 family protein [bacterium]